MKRWHAAACAHADLVGFSLLALCAGAVGLMYLLGPLPAAALWPCVAVLAVLGGYAGFLLKVLPLRESDGSGNRR